MTALLLIFIPLGAGNPLDALVGIGPLLGGECAEPDGVSLPIDGKV